MRSAKAKRSGRMIHFSARDARRNLLTWPRTVLTESAVREDHDRLNWRRKTSAAPWLDCICLFLRHVADNRQLKHLPLVRFQHQDDPNNQSRQADEWPQKDR